jgi:hypothetical protein
MATILSFVPRKTARPAAGQDFDAAAAIIIFPGVRYEQALPSEEMSGSGTVPTPPAAPAKPRH